MKNKYILDACCGGKTFWFDKNHENALFIDRRQEQHKLNYKRNRQEIKIEPDIVCDFKNMPFDDEQFNLVVFAPPHAKFNKSSIMYKKYGTLDDDFKEDLKKGFEECFRVLKKHGTLIFKWAESGIKVDEILNVVKQKPLFGHRTTRTTIWIAFMKF